MRGVSGAFVGALFESRARRCEKKLHCHQDFTCSSRQQTTLIARANCNVHSVSELSSVARVGEPLFVWSEGRACKIRPIDQPVNLVDGRCNASASNKMIDNNRLEPNSKMIFFTLHAIP